MAEADRAILARAATPGCPACGGTGLIHDASPRRTSVRMCRCCDAKRLDQAVLPQKHRATLADVNTRA